MWNLTSFRLETVLGSVQDRCMVLRQMYQGLQIILDAPNGTSGDEAQVEARFGRFGDSANLDARWVHGLHQMYHWIKSHFGHT